MFIGPFLFRLLSLLIMVYIFFNLGNDNVFFDLSIVINTILLTISMYELISLLLLSDYEKRIPHRIAYIIRFVQGLILLLFSLFFLIYYFINKCDVSFIRLLRGIPVYTILGSIIWWLAIKDDTLTDSCFEKKNIKKCIGPFLLFGLSLFAFIFNMCGDNLINTFLIFSGFILWTVCIRVAIWSFVNDKLKDGSLITKSLVIINYIVVIIPIILVFIYVAYLLFTGAGYIWLEFIGII